MSNREETKKVLCPSCQASDNNAYTDANGVAMRACGRDASPTPSSAATPEETSPVDCRQAPTLVMGFSITVRCHTDALIEATPEQIQHWMGEALEARGYQEEVDFTLEVARTYEQV